MLPSRAYSRKYQQAEREQLLRVKDELTAASRSSKERAQLLSKQTEQRRRALEEKKLAMARSEEERRRKALDERRRLQQQATNRFRNAIYKLKQVPKQQGMSVQNRQSLPVEIYLPSKPLKAQAALTHERSGQVTTSEPATPVYSSDRVAIGKNVEISSKSGERDVKALRVKSQSLCLDDVLDSIRGQNSTPLSKSSGSLNKHHHLPSHNSSPELHSLAHTSTDTLQSPPRAPPLQINNMVFVPATTTHSHVKESNATNSPPSPSRSPPESPLSSTTSSLQDSLDGSLSDAPTSESVDKPHDTLFHPSSSQEDEDTKIEKTDTASSEADSKDSVFSRRSVKLSFISAKDSLVLEDEEEKTTAVQKQDSVKELSATIPDQQLQHRYLKYLEQQQPKPKLPVSILKKPSATSTPLESATPVPNSANSVRQGHEENTPSVSKQSSAKRVRFVDDYRYSRTVHNNHTQDPLYSRESVVDKSAITPKMKILLTSRGGSALLSQRQQRHPSGKNGLVVPNLSAETILTDPKPPVDESATGSWPQVMQYAHQVTKAPLQEAPTTIAHSSNTSAQNTTDLRDAGRHSYASRLLPSSPLPETGQTHSRVPPVDINTSIALDRTPSEEDIGRLWNEITSYFHPTHHHLSHSATHKQSDRQTKQYEVLPVTYPQTGTHENQGYLLLPKTLAQGLRHSKARSATNIREFESSTVQQKLSASRPMRCYSMHQPVKLWKKPPQQNTDSHVDRLVELSSSGRQSPARSTHTRQGSMNELSAEEKKLMESIELLNSRLRGRISAEPGETISAHEYDTVDSGLNTNSNNNTGSYTSSGTRNRSLTVLPRTRVRRHPKTAAMAARSTTHYNHSTQHHYIS